MSILEKLTEGIVSRDLSKESHAIVSKWEKTGLLEGLTNDTKRTNMACLLENQAKELLRESSSMQAGDVEGFAAVAFPIVRRVFAGLIANDLVSVQPMSLPSGLIFFLDFTKDRARLGAAAGDSVYGGGAVANQITGGVSLTGANAEKSFYNLNNGYASPTGSNAGVTITDVLSGTVGGPAAVDASLEKILRFDPDIASGTTAYVGRVAISDLDQFNLDDLVTLTVTLSGSGRQARRLTQLSGTAGTDLLIVIAASGSETTNDLNPPATQAMSWAQVDDFTNGGAVGSVVGQTDWGLEGSSHIPEIDIKVDSVAVTAQTKKLKAKWTPELGQDLNAYHNLDAEVELTSILSEQIALEIDQEILEDLMKGATAGKLFWSRRPGKFLNRDTGAPISTSANEQLLGADFTGTVSEWYETLLETINDVSAQIHRKTLRGGANFLVCGPEVANILEFTAGFKATVTHDDDRGNAGAQNVGSISKKWDVYVDPYFPRNVVLVGRKGNSFLESGYVYAPYVPLQTTPTIFGTEDFVPRKGVMTRYAKKMVRPDMYGLVVVTDLLG
tara:strand:- start:724 stop:2397 length:1674 start_codon:yes stop_codon:yes gene_type:complete